MILFYVGRSGGMADAKDLESFTARCAGSSPVSDTKGAVMFLTSFENIAPHPHHVSWLKYFGAELFCNTKQYALLNHFVISSGRSVSVSRKHGVLEVASSILVAPTNLLSRRGAFWLFCAIDCV